MTKHEEAKNTKAHEEVDGVERRQVQGRFELVSDGVGTGV